MTFIAFIFLALISLAGSFGAKAEPLPALDADISRTTVSGLSSGAYMAGQFHIAYSSTVKGSAIIAGGPYSCARTPDSELNSFWFQQVLAWNLTRAVNSCMDDGWWFYSSVPSASFLYSHAVTLSENGTIDPISNLAGHKIYLFTSSEDETVHSGVVRTAREFYEHAGMQPDQIAFKENDTAAHAFLTLDNGLKCGKAGPPFINDCDLDQAGELLKWLNGSLKPPSPPAETGFIRFPQAEFISDAGKASMGAEGMAYIPQHCRNNRDCPVHIVFHGCKQGLERPGIGDRFVKESGYARWAEGNDMIILFPQATVSTLNPNGCWDWWGYTGRNFLERDALQMRAVKAMLNRLADSAQ